MLHLFIFILDILCTEEPSAIPHDDEYNESMEKDDGRVSIEHYVGSEGKPSSQDSLCGSVVG